MLGGTPLVIAIMSVRGAPRCESQQAAVAPPPSHHQQQHVAGHGHVEGLEAVDGGEGRQLHQGVGVPERWRGGGTR